MEKTMEERADGYASEIASRYKSPDSEVIYKSAYDEYVQIAKEQQKADALSFSRAFCDCCCSEDKRKSCDAEGKSCTMLLRYLQLGMGASGNGKSSKSDE